MAKEKANQPAAKFRLGYVTATVWKNQGTGDREFFSVEVSKAYKDGDEWKDTSSLGAADLLNAVKCL